MALRNVKPYSFADIKLHGVTFQRAIHYKTDYLRIYTNIVNFRQYIVLVEALCYNRKVAGSIPDEVIRFLNDLILPAALWARGQLIL
jgi:hypothetical protein